MNCPKCDSPMEEGELDLKAWGIGIGPQAQLRFNGDLLLKKQYVPLLGLFQKGTTAAAYRCRKCQMVCLSYESHTD